MIWLPSPYPHWPRPLTIILGIIFSAGLLAACDSDPTGEDRTSIEGTWSGDVGAVTVTVIFTAVDSPVGGQSVSGSGMMASPGESITFEAAGSYLHPILSLELEFDVPPGTPSAGTLSGQVNEARTQILATIAGPGVSGQLELSFDG